MSEEEQKEILGWIYGKMDTMDKLPNYRLHHCFVKNKTDKFPTFTMGAQLAKYRQKLPAYDESLPGCIWSIKERIMKKEGLFTYEEDPRLENFIYIICKNGSIHKHKDVNSPDYYYYINRYHNKNDKETTSPGLVHIRFNVFLELPKKGGETYYSSSLIDSKERCYTLSKSGLHAHWSNKVEDGQRISLSYGFIVERKKVNMMLSFHNEIIWPFEIKSETICCKGVIVSEDEQKEIIDWIYSKMNIFRKLSSTHYHHTMIELVTDETAPSDNAIEDDNTILPAYNSTLPKSIWEIKKRIIDREGLHWYKKEPSMQDFIQIICKDGLINKDPDLNYSDDLIHTRYDVFLDVPKYGGELYYDNTLVDVKEREYVLSKTGLHKNYSNYIKEGSMITLSFGFLIPNEVILQL